MRSPAGVAVPPTVFVVYCLLVMNSFLLLFSPKSSSGNNSLCHFEGVLAAASTAPKSGRQRERAAKQQLQHRQEEDQQIVYSCGSVTEDPVQLTVQGGKHNYYSIMGSFVICVLLLLFIPPYHVNMIYIIFLVVMPVIRMGRSFQGRMLHLLTMNIFHS